MTPSSSSLILWTVKIEIFRILFNSLKNHLCDHSWLDFKLFNMLWDLDRKNVASPGKKFPFPNGLKGRKIGGFLVTFWQHAVLSVSVCWDCINWYSIIVFIESLLCYVKRRNNSRRPTQGRVSAGLGWQQPTLSGRSHLDDRIHHLFRLIHIIGVGHWRIFRIDEQSLFHLL